MDKQIKLMQWVDKARQYIEADARNKKYPLAIELVEEHNLLIKEFDSVGK